MRNLQNIEPKWVLVRESLHAVSEFADRLPKARPRAFCPICRRPVILKLGDRNVHHYAHRPDDVCITSQPETALHLNTKFYIYQQLLQAQTIFVENRCTRYCGAIRKEAWLEKWDDVRVEYSTDSFRPDIALLSKGQVIGAIEVLVSHAVSQQKEEYFRNENIAWLEVQAEKTIYEGDEAWTPEKPLLFVRCHPQLERWMCQECIESKERARKLQEEQEKERKEQEERRKKQWEYEQNNYEVIHSAKMVDFYFKSGKKYREVYYVMKKVKNGEWIKAWVKTRQNRVVASENAPITKNSLKKLNEAVRNQIAEYRGKGTAIIDEFMEWQRWEKGQKFVARDLDRFPFRYSWENKLWDEKELKWVQDWVKVEEDFW